MITVIKTRRPLTDRETRCPVEVSMKPNKKWHTTGYAPSEYPDSTRDLVQYLVLRNHSGDRLDIHIERWVTDTDFSNGKGSITPAHFPHQGDGRLIGWQPLPQPITDDPTGWMSEYRGDDDPDEAGMYLCTTTRDNKRFDVKEVYWDSIKARWSPGTLREGEEVLAWRKYPKIPA
jgi:hypothetical protein